MFNVEDLTLHQGTFETPCLHFDVSIGTQVPRLPPLPQSHTDIEAVMDDEIVSSSHNGLRLFLMQWSGHRHYDASWIIKDTFRDLNSAVLEWYLQHILPESSGGE